MRNLIRRTDRISKAPEQERQQDSGGSMMRDMITENIILAGMQYHKVSWTILL